MKYCNRCGAALNDNATYCPYCGNSFQQMPQPVYYTQPAKSEESNTGLVLGILSLIFGLLGGSISLILGIIGLCFSKTGGQKALNIIGILLNIFWVIIWIILAVTVFAAMAV